MDDEVNNSYRVKLTNFPSFAGFQHVKKFIKSNLEEISFRKLKLTNGVAFFTVDSESAAETAVKSLDNTIFKKNTIQAKRVANCEPKEIQAKPAQNLPEPAKTAKELVTPLEGKPYAEQLELKFVESKKLLGTLRKQMFQWHIDNVPGESVLQKVLPSPVVDGYRNKCEFTIGYSGAENAKESNEIMVGFISGKMANRQLRVLPADDCPNLSRNTKAIVKRFQEFLREYGEEPFDEFQRTGFWKMLTVKDFLGDCLLIVTVHPQPDPEVSTKAKRALVETFMPSSQTSATPIQFSVTSIYWQEQANASDERVYELLAGPPFVYESLLGVSFRISPSTFFQTNSRAAAVLYTKIGDLLELPSPDAATIEKNELEIAESVDEDGASNEKKPKLETGQESALQNLPSILLLDICCGAGSIGLCLMQRLRKACPQTQFGCIGVELNVEAVRDAKRNATENGFDAKSCIYIDGQADKIFTDLQYHMPTGCSLSSSQIFGILDPPRAGVSDKVIIGCRKVTFRTKFFLNFQLRQLKTMAYVSCDPKSAQKNLIDLCRPFSRKYEGEPFRIVEIQPVDMFPMTEHFEWVVKLQR